MQELFLELVKLSLIGSLFALAVMLVRLAFRKAPKWLLCVLWGVVALRLILPVSIESKFSLVPDDLASGRFITNVGDGYVGNVDIIYENNAGYSNAVAAGRQPVYSNDGYYVVTEKDSLEAPKTIGQTVYPILSWVWVAGMVLLFAYTAVSYLVLRKKMAEATYLRDNIWQCEQVDSPFVLGIIKPRIYLPYAITDADMDNVIAHEQAHLRRKDHWWKPIGFLLLSVHWFNPVLWVAYILLCRDIEAACDEKVIKHMDRDEMRAYSTALLHCSVHHHRIAACPLAFGETGVKERIKRVMNYKKPAFWIVMLVVAASVAAGVFLLTSPAAGKETIQKIRYQEGYSVFAQQQKTITLSLPVSVLSPDIYSEEGVRFAENEIIAYQDDTATVYLKGARYANEGNENLYFWFGFLYDLPEQGGTTICPFEMLDNGASYSMDVVDKILHAGNGDFPNAVRVRGQDGDGTLWYYISTDALKQATGNISFNIRVNSFSYLKDGVRYEDAFPHEEGKDRMLELVEQIANNPECGLSSNPFTYIEARKAQYNEILTYGSAAVNLFVEQLRAGENGLQGYIMAAACSEITGIGEKTGEYDTSWWATAQEWLSLYESATSQTVSRNMTVADVVALSEKGKDLSYEDLKIFKFRDIGSGTYIYRYDIDSDYYLIVPGGITSGPILGGTLHSIYAGGYIDIREGGVDEFIKTHRADVLNRAITDAIEEHYMAGIMQAQSFVRIADEVVITKNTESPYEQEITLYLLVFNRGYKVINGSYKSVDNGKYIPTMIRFGVDSAGSYKLLKYWTPSSELEPFIRKEVLEEFPEGVAEETLKFDYYSDKLYSLWISIVLNRIGLSHIDIALPLEQKYPEYFQLNTDEGLAVYIYQMAHNIYSCVLMGENDTGYDWQALAGKPGTSMDEMRQIVQSYGLDRSEISIIPVQIPYSSYLYTINDAYRTKLEALFWSEFKEKGYKAQIAGNYPIANPLKNTYAAGEEVTIKLETLTEHYYMLYVNGVKQEKDAESSDMEFTYFTFTMPSEDVTIQIEDHWICPPADPFQ